MKTGQKKLTANEIVDLGVFTAGVVVEVAAGRIMAEILNNAIPSAPTKALAIFYKIGGYGLSLGISYGISEAFYEAGKSIKKGIAIVKTAKDAKKFADLFTKVVESEVPSGDEDGSGDTETELE